MSGDKSKERRHAHTKPPIDISNISMRDDMSEISNVSQGFGAYRTRNYNHFEQANLNQMVTRNQFS